MPPKVDKSKQKEKERVAVDKTFGMKNKNKSKVVQKYIKSITANAKGTSSKQDQDEKNAEKAKKDNMQKSALMNSLFNLNTDKKGRAFDPIAKKKAKQEEEEAIAAGKKLKEEIRKEIIEGIANTIRLTNPKGIRMSEMGGHAIIQALKDKHPDTFKVISLLLFIKANSKVFWVNDPEENNPMIRCQEDVDAEIAPDDRPIEEIIEEKRLALPPGGTPVTEESFKAWKEKREKERLEKLEEARSVAKKGGKAGQQGLSGKDLFTFDASLFVDDDGAVSADEYDERSQVGDEDEAKEKDEDEDDEDEVEDDAEDAGREKEGDEEDEDEKKADAEEAAPEAGEAAGEGAKGSGDAKAGGGEVVINKELFLQGGDVPDDLDDLDDLDDD
mmetsp:Transcript_42048/g.116110  ORF Transcript_42048/g.116110 Transcript_42048/m.116110 type:complete len:386 (+) Transcript_42048:204-1361(+)